MAISSESHESNPFPTSGNQSNDLGTTSMGSTGLSRDRMMDRVVQGAHEAVDRLAQRATPAIDALSGQADHWTEVQDEWVESARNTVRDHPLAALGAAVVFGMVVARLAR